MRFFDNYPCTLEYEKGCFTCGRLSDNIETPKLLVMACMVITSLVAGIFSVAPAAVAMMPVIVEICRGISGINKQEKARKIFEYFCKFHKEQSYIK